MDSLIYLLIIIAILSCIGFFIKSVAKFIIALIVIVLIAYFGFVWLPANGYTIIRDLLIITI